MQEQKNRHENENYKERDKQILSAYKERDSFKKAKLKRKKSKRNKK